MTLAELVTQGSSNFREASAWFSRNGFRKGTCAWMVVGLLMTLAPAGATAAGPTETKGKVVYVDDGDTVVLLSSERVQIKMRLSSIDAPESSHTTKEEGRVGQPFADKSKQYLSSMVKGRDVAAKCFEPDRYERQVCELFLNGESVNRAMVRAGFAWANKANHGRYLRDRSVAELQEDAERRKVGLWAGRNPVAPWLWRKQCWQGGVCASAE